MAGGTGRILVSGQDGVEEERLTQSQERRICGGLGVERCGRLGQASQQIGQGLIQSRGTRIEDTRVILTCVNDLASPRICHLCVGVCRRACVASGRAFGASCKEEGEEA